MSVLTYTKKYISVIYNQIFAGKRNVRQGFSVLTPASKKAVRKIVSKSQRSSLLSSSFSAIWVIPLSLWLFSAACTTEAIPCNGDATVDPEDHCLPFAPGNLDIKDLDSALPMGEQHRYSVNWEDMEGAEEYEITKICQAERVKLSDVNWGQTREESITDSEYELPAMYPGQVCYTRVRTCNQFGCGRWIEREFEIGSPGTVPSFPIIITTYAQLKTVKNGLNKHYRLGGDIDASPSWNEDDSSATTCVAYNGSNGATATCTGFTPIGKDSGNTFTGSFDGAGHKIKKLYVNRSSVDGVGLFGYTASNTKIKNIGVTDAYVVGKDSVGGLIGHSQASVSNSYATGNVIGGSSSTSDNVGGLIGHSLGSGSVSNSYATVTVTGSNYVGGLIGHSQASVSNSYATGDVTGTGTGTGEVGGIIGSSTGSVSNSYATGAVTGGRGGDKVGGLIGGFHGSGSVSNSYATGDVAGNTVGGLLGIFDGSGSVSNSYATGDVTGTGTGTTVGGLLGIFDDSDFGSVTGKNYFVDASGTDGIGGGTGACLSTVCVSQTAVQIAALDSSTSGWTTGSMGNWNFGTTTQLPAVLYSGTSCETIATNDINRNEGDTKIPDCGDLLPGQPIAIARGDFPSFPIIITTYAQLKTVKNGLSKHYRLGNDIDASASWNENDSGATCVAYNGSNGATPTCTGFEPIGNDRTKFSGSFDGAGHKIKRLYVNRSNMDGVGLFGYANGVAEIKNIGVTDAYVVGKDDVGGLVGSGASVANSYATGNVNGSGQLVGGLVGGYPGSISNSYATCDVRGGNHVGGLVGGYPGSISNSYATGNVVGITIAVGGLAGAARQQSISSSYATGDVRGGSSVGGLVGYLRGGGIASGKNYFVDGSGTNGIGGGPGSCSGGACANKTIAEIEALTSVSSWTSDDWNFGTTVQLPAVLYSGTSCETITGTNNVNTNEGDTSIPDCGDIIKGQR